MNKFKSSFNFSDTLSYNLQIAKTYNLENSFYELITIIL